MRVAIETLGTRGDVQPYVALARALIARGHDVQLAAPEQFADFAQANGVPFVGLPGEFLALMDSPEGKAAIGAGKGFSPGFKLLKHVRPMMMRLLEEEWSAVRSYRPDGSDPSSEVLRIPAYGGGSGRAVHARLPASRVHAHGGVPEPDASGCRSRAAEPAEPSADHPRRVQMLFAKDLRSDGVRANGHRSPGRSPARAAGTIYAYSPSVLPSAGRTGSATCWYQGYWFLDDSGLAARRAACGRFSRAGDKPVYVGFGSMPGIDPVRIDGNAGRGAWRKTGKARPPGERLGRARRQRPCRPHVHLIREAPHDRLLPLVSATDASWRRRHHGCLAPGRGADDDHAILRRSAVLGADA